MPDQENQNIFKNPIKIRQAYLCSFYVAKVKNAF
jgi:hypothetical protein